MGVGAAAGTAAEAAGATATTGPAVGFSTGTHSLSLA